MKNLSLLLVVFSFLISKDICAEEFISDTAGDSSKILSILHKYDQDSGWRFLKRGSGPIIGAGLIAVGIGVALSANCDRESDDESLCGFGEALIGGSIMGSGVILNLYTLPMAIGGLFSPYSSSKLNWIQSLPENQRRKEGELLLTNISNHYRIFRYISAGLSGTHALVLYGVGVYQLVRSKSSAAFFVAGSLSAAVSAYQFLVRTEEERLYDDYYRSQAHASLSFQPIIVPAQDLEHSAFGGQLELSF